MIEPTSLSAASEAGVTSTFEDFFIAEHERLFKALYMLTGNRDEADDLAQEASYARTSDGIGSARWSHRPGTCIERR